MLLITEWSFHLHSVTNYISKSHDLTLTTSSNSTPLLRLVLVSSFPPQNLLSVGKCTYLKFLDDGRVLHLDFKWIWGDDTFLQKNKVRAEFMKRHIHRIITASTLTHGKLTLNLFFA